MADIISLKSKIKLSDDKKAEMDWQRKFRVVQRGLRLSQSIAECEKCGIRIDKEGSALKPNLRVPYRFCAECSEEYIDYIEQLKGNEHPDKYWHNGAWQKLWRAWIDYRSGIDQFISSKEFRRLLSETKPH